MAQKTPTVNNKTLTLWDYEADHRIMEIDLSRPGEWPYWLEFLEAETTRSFRYVGADGTSCTVVKEKRRNGRFWYAHKRLNGKLRRKYLGRSANLTYKRLKAVAFELAQRKLV
jgi:hypothetical protein